MTERIIGFRIVGIVHFRAIHDALKDLNIDIQTVIVIISVLVITGSRMEPRKVALWAVMGLLPS